MLRSLILNLLPVWVVKRIYRLKPPTASFKTTTGRIFRLIKINDDFLLAVSNTRYDAEVSKKLVAMIEQGEAIRQAGIEGLNMLSFDERSRAMENDLENDRISRIKQYKDFSKNE